MAQCKGSAAPPVAADDIVAHVPFDAPKKPSGMSPKTMAATAALLFTNATMIVFVVMSGQEYPSFQYSFGISLALPWIPLCLVLHFIVHWDEEPFHPHWFLERSLHRLQDAVFVASMWATNYVFLLAANPHTPGVIQVIFNEMNIVVVVVWSHFLHGRRYSTVQYAALVVAIVGGMIPIANASDGDMDNGKLPAKVWYLIYLIGTAPIAIANTRTEKILQDSVREGRRVSIPLFFLMVNVWSVVFCLTLWWFPAATLEGNIWDHFSTGMQKIWGSGERGAIWTLIGIFLNLPSCMLTAYVAKQQDATYATLVLAVAPGMSGCWMAIRPLFGRYYQELDWTSLVSFPIIFVAVLIYKWSMFGGKPDGNADPDVDNGIAAKDTDDLLA